MSMVDRHWLVNGLLRETFGKCGYLNKLHFSLLSDETGREALRGALSTGVKAGMSRMIADEAFGLFAWFFLLLLLLSFLLLSTASKWETRKWQRGQHLLMNKTQRGIALLGRLGIGHGEYQGRSLDAATGLFISF